MIVTSEYIYINPELYEINDIIQKTRREHDQNYGDEYSEEIEIKFNVKFLNKTKINKKYCNKKYKKNIYGISKQV